jgi:hypothetical protein
MKLKTNIFVQLVSTAGQLLNAYGGLIPPKYQVIVASGLGIAQGIAALIAHFSNTNGTPQEQPGGAAANQ